MTAVENDVFLEKPFGPRFAGVLHTFTRQESLGASKDEADLALKARVAAGARWATSVQAGVIWSRETPSPDIVGPLPACPDYGGELRGLAGESTRGGRGFLNVEAGYRYRAGCSHVRYEATAGFRADPKWLVLGQVFVDDDLRFGEDLKLQAGVVRFNRKGRGLQLSLRTRISEGDVIEPTIILGYWSTPRHRSDPEEADR